MNEFSDQFSLPFGVFTENANVKDIKQPTKLKTVRENDLVLLRGLLLNQCRYKNQSK